MKRLLALSATLLMSLALFGQTGYLPYDKDTEKFFISPNYFGPNAFPVPDMLKGTADKLELEVCANGALGHLASTRDKTLSADFLLHVPLWTDRVNLSVWIQAWEIYEDTPEVRVLRRVRPEEPLTGGLTGDCYFSVDMLALREKRFAPAVTVRAACKTASGDEFERARYYDCPGYFFDLCASKGIPVSKNLSLSAALSAGFLCWQIADGRQNDALMYGVSLGLESSPLVFHADFGGYSGRLRDGDHPMTIKLRAQILPGKRVSPMVCYQRGFRDWPFDQLGLGARFSFDVLHGRQAKND